MEWTLFSLQETNKQTNNNNKRRVGKSAVWSRWYGLIWVIAKKAEFPNVVSAFSGKEVINNKSCYTSLLPPGRKTCCVQSVSGFQLEAEQALLGGTGTTNPSSPGKVKSLSRVWLFVTPGAVAYQAPPSMAFSRQEYWSGLPFPSPGDLPNPGIEPRSPAFHADALTSEPPGKQTCFLCMYFSSC